MHCSAAVRLIECCGQKVTEGARAFGWKRGMAGANFDILESMSRLSQILYRALLIDIGNSDRDKDPVLTPYPTVLKYILVITNPQKGINPKTRVLLRKCSETATN